MLLAARVAAWIALGVLAPPVSFAATITGAVKGPEGQPFEGAFVAAQNTSRKIAIDVPSGKDGRYRVEKLPAGTYDLKIRAVGYKAQPKAGVSLTADQNASLDFGLQKAHWCAGAISPFGRG
jgi:hypothetical protein